MTPRELIGILQTLEQDSHLAFSLGDSDEYRMACAKAEVEEQLCLYDLDISEVRISVDNDGELHAAIQLRQTNYANVMVFNEQE